MRPERVRRRSGHLRRGGLGFRPSPGGIAGQGANGREGCGGGCWSWWSWRGACSRSRARARSPTGLTFTVTSAPTTDDGTCDATHCTLREAISAANADAGPRHDRLRHRRRRRLTRSPRYERRRLSTNAVTIDATTEAGLRGHAARSSTGRRRSRLNGRSFNVGQRGLDVRGSLTTGTVRDENRPARRWYRRTTTSESSPTAYAERETWRDLPSRRVEPRRRRGIVISANSRPACACRTSRARRSRAIASARTRRARRPRERHGSSSATRGVEIGPSSSGAVASGIVSEAPARARAT